jgi:glutaminase
MVNAGAIVTTSLVVAPDAAARFKRILGCLSAFAGRDLDVDEQVHASEVATGDRNRALAYLMRGAGSLVGDVHEIVETYFRQCSVRVTAADLAVMAATLANGGVNPLTGATVVEEPVAVQVLALRATCGLYDEAGAWLLRVGLPAKSGVSGGLIAASPARFGIAVYSPPLDHAGNSVRGVLALTEASERLALHIMHRPLRQTLTVTDRSTAREHPSNRTRDAAATALLHREGHRIAIVSAQGTLEFTEAERVLHEVRAALPPAPGWLVLDLERVTHIATGAAMMLGTTLGDPARSGYEVSVTAQESMAEEAHRDGDRWTDFANRDQAVAWCEDRLPAAHG